MQILTIRLNPTKRNLWATKGSQKK